MPWQDLSRSWSLDLRVMGRGCEVVSIWYAELKYLRVGCDLQVEELMWQDGALWYSLVKDDLSYLSSVVAAGRCWAPQICLKLSNWIWLFVLLWIHVRRAVWWAVSKAFEKSASLQLDPTATWWARGSRAIVVDRWVDTLENMFHLHILDGAEKRYEPVWSTFIFLFSRFNQREDKNMLPNRWHSCSLIPPDP